MHAKIYAAAAVGIEAHLIDVEVDLANGLINFCIVGLPDKTIKESRERIRAAFKNSGLKLPSKLITVNLAPAHLKKQDSLFDIPIAISILQAAKLIELTNKFIEETVILGELSLDGTIRPIFGVLVIAQGIKTLGKKRIIVPVQNAQEASLIKELEVIGVSTFVELVAYLRAEKAITPTPFIINYEQKTGLNPQEDFSQVCGQRQVKRALQIAATGKHNILFVGPPGSGKSMLAQRLKTILPPMTFEEAVETTKIYSIAGLLSQDGFIKERPFRSPHHSISRAGLVGGGSIPIPGEISLAHNGILFLDELTEFERTTLETLRQPLENKKILISRAQAALEFPANFLLICALNPCPCGYYQDKTNRCQCSKEAIKRYIGKLSGPLLDRIDLHVHVAPVLYEELTRGEEKEVISSKTLYNGVMTGVAMQKNRQGETINSELSTQQITSFITLNDESEKLMGAMFEKLSLSIRSYHKILKVARTIADIEGSSTVTKNHLLEAFSYRSFHRE